MKKDLEKALDVWSKPTNFYEFGRGLGYRQMIQLFDESEDLNHFEKKIDDLFDKYINKLNERPSDLYEGLHDSVGFVYISLIERQSCGQSSYIEEVNYDFI